MTRCNPRYARGPITPTARCGGRENSAANTRSQVLSTAHIRSRSYTPLQLPYFSGREAFVGLTVNGVGGGYPSDLTDEQWALVEPLLPSARVGPKGGRREKNPRRRIVDATFRMVRTGCAWRQLPNDFAPWPTVYWYFT